MSAGTRYVARTRAALHPAGGRVGGGGTAGAASTTDGPQEGKGGRTVNPVGENFIDRGRLALGAPDRLTFTAGRLPAWLGIPCVLMGGAFLACGVQMAAAAAGSAAAIGVGMVLIALGGICAVGAYLATFDASVVEVDLARRRWRRK